MLFAAQPEIITPKQTTPIAGMIKPHLTYLAAACILSSCLLSGAAAADELVTIGIDKAWLSLNIDKGFYQVQLKGGIYQSHAGAPFLPELGRHILLPPGHEAAGIEVLAAVPETIRLSAPVLPCPEPLTVSLPAAAPPLTAIDTVIYGSDRPYPDVLARLTGQGSLGGYRLAAVVLAPVRYVPAQNILIYYPWLTVKLLTRRRADSLPSRRDPYDMRRRMVAKLVVNPEALDSYGNEYSGVSNRDPVQLSVRGRGDPFDYLIVTSGRLAPALEPLARWKTRKGTRAQIVLADSLVAHYPGADPAERLRAGIRDAYLKSGAGWVLLAGDIEDVPHRVAAGYPGDLYFSDLDGDWNLDRDAVWGEAEDGVDLYPEVFVGRLPVSDTAAAGNLVRKIIAYEQAAINDYQTKLLFIGADLDAQTPTSRVKDSIEAVIVSHYAGLTVDKLYPATSVPLNRANVLAALNAGCNLVNFSDHADYYSMGTGLRTGGGQIYASDAAGLSNAGRPEVIYTIGCYNGAFDKSCIGEQFLKGPNGAAAFIGCSREAWYIPGQPLASVSYRYDREFFAALLDDSCYSVGAALGMAKARLIPSSGDGLMRWSQYEINLLGDPEMPVWTGLPRALAVSLPESLGTGLDTIVVAVADSATGIPLTDARVCLTNDHGLFAVAVSDGSGAARFICDPVTADTLRATVTAQGYRPWSAGIPVRPSPLHLAIAAARTGDTGGNGDGVPNPGEAVTLSLLVANNGTVQAESLCIQLTGLDTMASPGSLTISHSAALAPGDSVWVAASPPLTLSPSCPDGRRISLNASSLTGHFLRDSVAIRVCSDSLALEHYTLVEAAGDGDGQAEAGETIEIAAVRLGNHGAGRADSVRLRLIPLSPGIVMQSDSLLIWSIPPRAGATALGAFRCSLSAAGPYSFRLVMTDRYLRQWTGDFAVLRRPPAPSTPVIATDRAGLKVSWERTASACGYAVYRSPADTAPSAEVSPLVVRNCLYFTDPNAVPDSSYSYAVAAVDSSGCLSLMSAAAGNTAPVQAAAGWPQNWGVYDSWNWNAPAVGDINGDGAREILMANPSGIVYAWNADGATLAGWPRRLSPAVNGPAALADLDGDQTLDIIIAHGDTLSALRHDGGSLPGWPYAAGSSVSAPALGDLDRDGRLEIIVASGGNQVRALGWNGAAVTELWRWTLPAGTAPKISLGDVRGGSLPEIIVTGWSGSGTKGYILDGLGVVQDSFASPVSGDNNVAAPALLADINGDGKSEIVAAFLTGRSLLAWDGTGAPLWRSVPGTVWGTPTAFCAPGDSLPRIAVATLEGYLCQLDHNGQAVPGWPVYWRAMHASPAAGDLDGDGAADLVCRGDYGSLTAWSAGGPTLPGFPIQTQDGNYSPVTLARPSPEDGFDIFADTRANQVFRWRRSGPAADPPDWPLQGHDIHRTNRHGALIDWCGRVSRSMTISGDNFINGDVTIEPGATVTVLSGSRLYFSDRRDFDDRGTDPQRAEVIVKGHLTVQGSPDDSVFFDTWSNAPIDSSWHGIRIEPGGSATMNHCGIRHSLNGLYYAGFSGKPEFLKSKPELRLEQNQPNPFKRVTTINYQIPKSGIVYLAVYNIAGQKVRTLAIGVMPAGAHSVAWDGRGAGGAKVSSGVYLCRLQAGGMSLVGKMLLLQ